VGSVNENASEGTPSEEGLNGYHAQFANILEMKNTTFLENQSTNHAY
jgi:hypothetical protein